MASSEKKVLLHKPNLFSATKSSPGAPVNEGVELGDVTLRRRHMERAGHRSRSVLRPRAQQVPVPGPWAAVRHRVQVAVAAAAGATGPMMAMQLQLEARHLCWAAAAAAAARWAWAQRRRLMLCCRRPVAHGVGSMAAAAATACCPARPCERVLPRAAQQRAAASAAAAAPWLSLRAATAAVPAGLLVCKVDPAGGRRAGLRQGPARKPRAEHRGHRAPLRSAPAAACAGEAVFSWGGALTTLLRGAFDACGRPAQRSGCTLYNLRPPSAGLGNPQSLQGCTTPACPRGNASCNPVIRSRGSPAYRCSPWALHGGHLTPDSPSQSGCAAHLFPRLGCWFFSV